MLNNSIELDNFLIQLKKADMVLNHQFDRFEKYMTTVSEKDFPEVLEKLLKWEKKFEEG